MSRRSRSINESASLVQGTIVVLDLDKFEELTKKFGLDPYKPNFITGELTELIERLARNYGGVVIYGLDPERGTEEALLEFPFVKPRELLPALEEIREAISRLGASISIVAIEGMVSCAVARTRRELVSTPWRALAYKELRALKRRGGGRVLVT
ncbi:MAG: hypothetical protein QXU97_01790 [Fervidicoccaceae archaeon]